MKKPDPKPDAGHLSTLIAVGFIVILLLSMGVCLFLMAELDRSLRESEKTLALTHDLRSMTRRLVSNYLYQADAVGGVLLEGNPASYRRQLAYSDSIAESHLELALASTQREDLRVQLEQIRLFDHHVTDSLEERIVALALIDERAARKIFMGEYRIARQHKLDMVRAAIQMASGEVDDGVEHNRAEVSNVRNASVVAMGVFALTGIGIVIIFMRWTAIVASRLERAHVLRAEELRRFASAIQTVQEEERRSIADDLHDDLGQTLTGLRMSLSELVDRAGKGVETPVQRLSEIKAQVDNMIAKVRALSGTLRPAILTKFGLCPALKNLCDEFQKSHSIEIHFESVGQLNSRYPSNVEIALYRITQEALTNIAKHTVCTTASCRYSSDHDGITIAIQDNGSGFSQREATQRSQTGLGLITMRERAESLGGSCVVESVPGKGTVVLIKCPVKEFV